MNLDKKLPITAIDGPRRGQNNLQLADFCFQRYFLDLAKLPFQVTFDDLMKPTFWAHHTKKLKENDIVRVAAADDCFDLDLVVMAIGAGGVLMRVWEGNRPPPELYARAEAAAARYAP